MSFASVPEAIEEIRAGRMLVVVDDEDRENEGDLTIAAEKVTPEVINFMATHGRGLICLTLTPERCDALDYARKLAAEFPAGALRFGVLICGSGQAMTMAANRYRHLRAALCGGVEMARTTREHNDANVLVLAADFTPPDEALKILATFLDTQFLGGRYAERRDALTALGGL